MLFATTALYAQRDYEPTLQGYVTRIASSSEIDVNGTHIRIESGTEFFIKAPHNKYTRIKASDAKFRIGQSVEVFGKRHDKEHAIDAKEINLCLRQPIKLSGSGVIDAIPPAPVGSTPEGQLLRADGYLILVTKQTEQNFQPPLTAASAFQTNVWVNFHGSLRADGVLAATEITFRPNVVKAREERVREQTEHDPAAVDPAAEQSSVSMLFNSVDPTKIPPHKDEKMQARVTAIGEKLVPKYQRDLPATDPTKVNFRFQVVEDKDAPITVAWPNGIVLVPNAAVERLKDDSQLAAVLAESIARVMEKHPFGLQQYGAKRGAGALIGVGEGVFDPIGGAVNAASYVYVLSHKKAFFCVSTPAQLEQSSRVSLSLMHDAGYDIDAAPLAWWLLADEKSKGLDKTSLPFLSEYLYKFLGETWHSQ